MFFLLPLLLSYSFSASCPPPHFGSRRVGKGLPVGNRCGYSSSPLPWALRSVCAPQARLGGSRPEGLEWFPPLLVTSALGSTQPEVASSSLLSTLLPPTLPPFPPPFPSLPFLLFVDGAVLSRIWHSDLRPQVGRPSLRGGPAQGASPAPETCALPGPLDGAWL